MNDMRSGREAVGNLPRAKVAGAGWRSLVVWVVPFVAAIVAKVQFLAQYWCCMSQFVMM